MVKTKVEKVVKSEPKTSKEVDQDITIPTPRTTPDPIFSNLKKQVTKFPKTEVETEEEVAETEVANRISKVEIEEEITIKETLTIKLDNHKEEEDSKIKQLKELDQTQEDSNKDQTELHSTWQLVLSRMLRCLKRR